jgi:hypothetical protein
MRTGVGCNDGSGQLPYGHHHGFSSEPKGLAGQIRLTSAFRPQTTHKAPTWKTIGPFPLPFDQMDEQASDSIIFAVMTAGVYTNLL